MDSSHKNVLEQNKQSESSVKVENPVGVFIGATSGIGQGSAKAFARHTKNATVYIVGRNAKAAEEILNELKTIQPSGNFKFLKCDLTLLKNAKSMTKEILASEKKINVLSLSCGTFDMASTETEEGLIARKAVMFYSRWMIADQLAPLVAKAAEAGEPARVNTIMNPQDMIIVDKQYIDSDTTSLVPFMKWSMRMNNVAVEKYSHLYPNVAFINTHPGSVSTGIARDTPWYFRALWAPINYFLESIDSCGERLHYVNYVSDKISPGSHYLDNKLREHHQEYEQKGFLTQESQDVVYEHIREIFDRF